jgi:hypothetical protein
MLSTHTLEHGINTDVTSAVSTNECCEAILICNIKISRLFVFSSMPLPHELVRSIVKDFNRDACTRVFTNRADRRTSSA